MDYDVAAASLASPPTSAPVASYRPSVAVQNLGIHPASVTGTLRIYDRDAGTLLRTMALTSTTVPVGATRNALADQLWEPVAGDIGKAFIFIATVVYPEDQYLANNNLAPVTVIVTAAPPPPPPPVEAHASQHEQDGGDEITVEGLTGKLAEAQDPTEHASAHESGGDDELSVSDLVGELATPQTPKTHATSHQPGGSDVITGIPAAAHHASHEPGGSDVITGIAPSAHSSTHENGGADELDVSGLSGTLADEQNPTDHATNHDLGGSDQTYPWPGTPRHVISQGFMPANIPGGDTAEACSYGFTHYGEFVYANFHVTVVAELDPGEVAIATATIKLHRQGQADQESEPITLEIYNDSTNPQTRVSSLSIAYGWSCLAGSVTMYLVVTNAGLPGIEIVPGMMNIFADTVRPS